MVIGIDASRAFRQQRTGVEEYAYQLLRAMAETTPDGIEVRLYVQKLRPPTSDLRLPSSWHWKLLPVPARLWTHTALAWELFRHPPDVFFQPAHVLPIEVGSWKLEVGKTKIVLTIHDVGFARIPWAYSRFDRWYQHLMTRSAVSCQRSGVRMIVPSGFTKKELQGFYSVPSDQITVIPHATVFGSPSTGSGHNKVLPERSRRHTTDQCGFPYLLSIGRIEKKKNTLGMIQWFERKCLMTNDKFLMPNGQQQAQQNDIRHLKLDLSHFILIGPDGYGASEVYAYLAKRPELQARVHLLGFVSEQHKKELLAGAQALLHLSHYEGFGLPIAEAKAVGTPVILRYEIPDTRYDSKRTWTDAAFDTWQVLLCSGSGA